LDLFGVASLKAESSMFKSLNKQLQLKLDRSEKS
jgi:hypothetical protein